jgi:ribonuclease Z
MAYRLRLEGEQTESDYAAVIVDEVQDISELALRLLHSLVGNREDGFLLVGDTTQRIFTRGYSLRGLGIDIGGRGLVLRKNYRNTKQILEAAFPLVENEWRDDLTEVETPTLDVVVRMLAGLWGEGRAPIPLELVPLTEGQVLDAGEFTIGCFPVRHRDTDSFGFSFESQVRRHLRLDRLIALGVPDGPVRKELAEGRPVTLADGRMVDPNEVLGPPEGRKRLVIVGDAETTNGLAKHARGADVLVIEATFLDRDAAIARDYGHLTAAEAAALAAVSNVKQLVLTHISGRYSDDEILAEAGKTFPNSRLAVDFDHIVV